MKKIVLIIGIMASLGGVGLYIRNDQKRKETNKIISTIDLNELEGNFIVIKSYEKETIYEIDERIFDIELTIYLAKINENISYDFKIEKNDNYLIKIEYFLYGEKIKKEYTLNLNK